MVQVVNFHIQLVTSIFLVCYKGSPESVIYLSLNWILDNTMNTPLDRRFIYHKNSYDNDYHPHVGIFPSSTSLLPGILVTMTVTFVLVIKLVTFTSHSANLCVTYGVTADWMDL